GLSNLAVTERHNGDYAAARSLYERALVIFEKTIGPGADFATCMNNLGDLLDDMGDYATAGPLHERALSIQKQTLGPDHPDVGMSLDSLARWHAVKGETAGALEAALEVERISLEHLRLTSRSFSERQALRYAVARQSDLDLALTLAARGIDGA